MSEWDDEYVESVEIVVKGDFKKETFDKIADFGQELEKDGLICRLRIITDKGTINTFGTKKK